MSDTQFKGYAVRSSEKWSEFSVIDFEPKKFEDTDVDIAITHCGVCGSDVHTLTGGWGEANFPLIAGHEVAGKVTRVGPIAAKETGLKVGDRAGVGAQIGSCYKCRACKSDNENYCPDMIDTYNAKYPDGTLTQGGYSTAVRANHLFVFPIPDGLESRHAASMLCAGLTVYSPLVRNGCGPGKKVAIIGIGGLGHYAIMFAKALGAEVFALSHDKSKEEDAKALGADHYVYTGDDKEPEFAKPLASTFDIIISTRDIAGDSYPLKEYLSMLWVNGIFISVGIPDQSLPQITVFDMMPNGARMGGSHIGSKKEALAMLDLAAKKGIKPWIEELPMKDVSKAVQGVKHNKVRYRYVLTQDLN